LVTTAIIILVTIPVVWLLAKRVSAPMRRLARAAERIRRFDFSEPIRTRSFVAEVDQLAVAMGMMKETINRFLTLINSLAGERDFDTLLDRINRETLQVSQADAVLTYLLDESDSFLEPVALQEKGGESGPVDAFPTLSLEQVGTLTGAGADVSDRPVRVDPEGPEPLLPLLERLGVDRLSVVTLPLHNRQQELIGLLCLIYRTQQGTDERQQQEQIAFVRAMSGFAAVSLEGRQLLMMQEALLDSFIKLIAGAIDAKSPYTGGHCQRVPELTRMLAQAANEAEGAPFGGFRMDREQWEALEIASWLHDCGKVTTPEYVVDKATKLEGIHDRIHEIRMRFEVLKRDAVIAYWQQLAAGDDAGQLKQLLQEEWRQLDDDFAFVAECNQGGEFMAPERMERLRQIGERRWMRTLDDRAGISHEEMERKQQVATGTLPAEERLLADKPEHRVERVPTDQLAEENPWGFQLDVPEYKYNRGELYNLGIKRGTLTAEERYVINDHIVQTIMMLEKLPYPRHLRDVPLIAGCHHETMDGRGYPRRLTGEQMPLTARMMAIADIFEALTASDRPYKKAKRLSEAVRIMGNMVKQGHIDPALFQLFLKSGIHLEYGRRFLRPEQMDEVDPDLAISVQKRLNKWTGLTGFTGLCNSVNSVNPEQSCKSCHFFGAGNGLYSLQSVQFSSENVFFLLELISYISMI
jgi:HD-GYP domain-containing protein (c-di-GMP phosphodiesterase class II)/HAMP domain-containing protein